MEDSNLDWDNLDYSPDRVEDEGEVEKSGSRCCWVLSKGLSLGRKLVVTGVVVTSAPIVIPPLLVVSALGVASSVPFGFICASYVCTEKIMSILLPLPGAIGNEEEEEVMNMIGYMEQLGDDVLFDKRYYQEELANDNGEFAMVVEDSGEGLGKQEEILQKQDMIREDTTEVAAGDGIVVTGGEESMIFHGEDRVQLDGDGVGSSENLVYDNDEVMQLPDDYCNELRDVEELREDGEDMWKDDMIRGDSFGATEGDAPASVLTDFELAAGDMYKKEVVISDRNDNVDMPLDEGSISSVGIVDTRAGSPGETGVEGVIAPVEIEEEFVVEGPVTTAGIPKVPEIEGPITRVEIVEEFVVESPIIMVEGPISPDRTPEAAEVGIIISPVATVEEVGVEGPITTAGTPEALEAEGPIAPVEHGEKFVVEGPIITGGVLEETMVEGQIAPNQTSEADGVEISITPVATVEEVGVEGPITTAVHEALEITPIEIEEKFVVEGSVTTDGVVEETMVEGPISPVGTPETIGVEISSAPVGTMEGVGIEGLITPVKIVEEFAVEGPITAAGVAEEITVESPTSPDGTTEAIGAETSITPVGTMEEVGADGPTTTAGTPEALGAEGPISRAGIPEAIGMGGPITPAGTVEELLVKGPSVPDRTVGELEGSALPDETVLVPELHGGVKERKIETSQSGLEDKTGTKLERGSDVQSEVTDNSSQKEMSQSDLKDKPDTNFGGTEEKNAHGLKAAGKSKKGKTNARGKKKFPKTPEGPITSSVTPEALVLEGPITALGKPEAHGVGSPITTDGIVEELVVEGPTRTAGEEGSNVSVATVLGPELHGGRNDSRSKNGTVHTGLEDKIGTTLERGSEGEVADTSSSQKEIVQGDLKDKHRTNFGEGDEKNAHGSKGASKSKKGRTNAKGKKRTPKTPEGPITLSGTPEALGAESQITPAETPEATGVEGPITPVAIVEEVMVEGPITSVGTPEALVLEGPITAVEKPELLGVGSPITTEGIVEELVVEGPTVPTRTGEGGDPTIPAETVLGPDLHGVINNSRRKNENQTGLEDNTGTKLGRGHELQGEVTDTSSSQKELVQSDLKDKLGANFGGGDEQNVHGLKGADNSKKRHTNAKGKKRTPKTQKTVQGDISKAQEKDQMKHEGASGKVNSRSPGSAARESKLIWDGDVVVEGAGLSPQIVGELKITEVLPVDKNKSGPSIKDDSKICADGNIRKNPEVGNILGEESKEKKKNVGQLARDTADSESKVQILEVSAPVHMSKQDDEALKLKGNSSAHEADKSHHHEKDVPRDDEIWKQIESIRLIVGFKLPRHTSYFEELKALYLFTGIEPPSLFRDSLDMPEFCHKLRFLMSVIGVK